MRPFNHINATSLSEASAALKNGNTVALAGGGDLLNAMKDNIFPTYPKTVVNLKSIADLDYIIIEDNALKIGALATLADIARSELVCEHAPALADAAGRASSPSLRETTTIGGNLCQMPRCWYYRKLDNRFDCARKGGERCFALTGDNRYHSAFGAATFETADGAKRSCVAVNQGDLAPVLTVFTATIATTEREIKAYKFFAVGENTATVLTCGELVREIQIPLSEWARTARYKRFSFRKSIDFPVVSVAIAVNEDKDYHVCLGGVAPTPIIAEAAEELLLGKEITAELAAAAGVAATEGARPFDANRYKVKLVETLVKRELLAMM